MNMGAESTVSLTGYSSKPQASPLYQGMRSSHLFPKSIQIPRKAKIKMMHLSEGNATKN